MGNTEDVLIRNKDTDWGKGVLRHGECRADLKVGTNAHVGGWGGGRSKRPQSNKGL